MQKLTLGCKLRTKYVHIWKTITTIMLEYTVQMFKHIVHITASELAHISGYIYCTNDKKNLGSHIRTTQQ